ncbi:hypothetical protein BCF55_0582 [Hydrogenivirga caldilitoris]|uniref:Uncharacterized protein n=1 Tax=Hydrogenivirga caldilitoris TaxID=246264 RepID=A0A497XPZ6_9AQUI|nr:hypothetical protein [Hydrogenivirga caldilitoris]RLJ70314.1 hypothetical protein BCF55_0582 [Hydrogenivirga caldilitoris]
MKEVLIGLALIGALAFGITEGEFKSDVDYVQRVEKRLDVLDKKAQEEGLRTEIIDELNSYGYPLQVIKDKYFMENEARYKKFYEKVKRVYEKVLFVKRGIFPEILRREISGLHIPFCDVKSEGKRRETLTLVMKNPDKEADVIKVMTQTQLQYAHLLGIESIKFEKCR